MNRQRKVLVTVTYNELGIIVDTKTEELDSSAQPSPCEFCKHNDVAADGICLMCPAERREDE